MIEAVKRKSMEIRYSGRSSDYISPSFGFGCLYQCSYCYLKRHKPKGLTYATNVDQILYRIKYHANHFNHNFTKPNQTDAQYITYDISCNEDFALHNKYYDWKKIFNFFRDNSRIKATFATKTIPLPFLDYNPYQKVRIRFSLMPQKISSIVEPNTASIYDRILAVNRFIRAGYDVHLNFSPVILYAEWLHDYKELFNLVDKLIDDRYKEIVKAEVIFLTHNENKHKYNLENNVPGEHLLWVPHLQETKKSTYGNGENIRYKWTLKADYIEQFKTLHNKVIPWNYIRYIF